MSTRFPCVIITPFGLAVVPDVYMMTAVSSGVTATVSILSLREAPEATRSSKKTVLMRPPHWI